MIISIDTETQGLNCQAFLMGCICHENMKTETFRDRHKMWTRILEIGEKQKAKGESLFIYAHNMQYDYYTITTGEDTKGLYTYSHNPYIVDAQREDGRIYMKFLSTTSLFHGTLAEMGETLGIKKGETPEWCKQDEYKPNFAELHMLEQYMIQDTKIIMHYIQHLKKLLTQNHMQPRWIITASQIGIAYLIKELKKAPNKNHFFYNEYENKLHYSARPHSIREAVRGGRVQAFVTGHYNNATMIDINSHYPNCLATMKCPNLATQTLHDNPEEKGWNIQTLLNNIGIMHCALTITKETLGVLPIRITEEDTIYPSGVGSLLIGTWTHREIQAAIKRGYTLKKTFWSMTWEETKNPFKPIIETLYTMKKEAKTPMEKHFAKMLLNGAIGKFAQEREKNTYAWDTIENDTNRTNEGWEPIALAGTDRLYKKYEGIDYPQYYSPVINALVTAEARIQLLELMEKIPEKTLYYVDTDAIIGNADAIRTAKYKYGVEQGLLKIQAEKEPFYAYGKKTYSIGTNIKISGVGKTWITKQKFQEGTILYKKMITEKETTDKTLIGTFRREKRTLHETKQTTKKEIETTKKPAIYIDTKSNHKAAINWLNNTKENTWTHLGVYTQ